MRTPRRPGRVALLVAVALAVPALIAGLLVAALWDPAQRMPTVTAAIVNNDKPVRLEGQLAPMGRQLAARLAHPVDDTQANYHWVITSTADADRGLADGSYAAVVTIPKNFSTAVTSFAGSDTTPTQATIDVRSGDQSGVADPLITQMLTATARQVFGAELTARYLENVYVGFGQLRGGLVKVSNGASELDSGTGKLSDGTRQLADGTGTLAGGLARLADGTGALSDGVARLAAGVDATTTGAHTLARGTKQLSDGAEALAAGLAQTAAAADTAGAAAATADTGLRTIATALQGVATAIEYCQAHPDAQDCPARIYQALAALPDADTIRDTVVAAATTDGYLNGAGDQAGLVTALAGLADGAADLSDGLTETSGGTRELADGLSQLNRGASGAAAGAATLAGGAGDASDGAGELSTGADELADGIGGLSTGTGKLSAGLQELVANVPSYSEQERVSLATVVAAPVAAPVDQFGPAGPLGAALFATLALWLGTLLAYLVLPPVAPHALESARASWRLTLRAFAPGAGLGAAQGALVGVVVAHVLDIDTGPTVGFVILAVLAGVAFAAFQQGLAGLLGSVGRALALVWGVVALLAGLLSTTPSWFDLALTQLPLGPAVRGLRTLAAGAPDGFASGAVAGLVVVALLGLALTLAATSRRRGVPVDTTAEDARVPA